MISRRGVRASAMFTAAFVLAASSVLGQTSTVAAGFDARRVAFELLSATSPFAAPLAKVLRGDSDTNAISMGNDGRLTFLLVGLDARGSAVTRADAIMVMSVKGNTISAASIPRDISRIPNPSGGTFSGKVNTILRQLISSMGSVDAGFARFEVVIENALDVEIDYRAMIWFNGFSTLVGVVDPITVNVEKEIADPKHLDDPNGPPGVYFPRWNGYALYANNTGSNPRCNGAYKSDPPPIAAQYWCHRALPYVRSRKGPQNDDFHRAKRQQFFIAAAIKAVSSSELGALTNTGKSQGLGKWITNYPINSGSALDLFNAVKNATLVHNVVFKPKTYAGRVPGTSQYELKLSAVRQWTAQYMS